MLNGTQVSTALAMSGAIEARQALDSAISIGALTTEALLGSVSPFEDRILQIRRQPGQMEVARRLRELTKGSEFRFHERADRSRRNGGREQARSTPGLGG